MAPWFYWALLSACFAALTAILAKIGIGDVDPDIAAVIRSGIATVLIMVVVAAAGKWAEYSAPSARTWTALALSGFASAASWLCYFRALQLGDASKVAPVDKLSLVLVAIFAFVFLGERPSLREGLGIAIVAVGITVLAWHK